MTTEGPTLREIVDKGPKQFLTPAARFERYLLRACALGLVALGVWLFVTNGVAHQADTASQRANHAVVQANVSIESQCLFYYGVGLASGPTLPANITKVGLSILVGARAAYQGLGCNLGALPKPAPQVAADLPSGVH